MIPNIFKQSSTDRIQMITEGNILKTFLFLSIPSIMMVFIQSVMPIVDGLFVYQYADPVSGAAISYCAPMQNIFIMATQGFATAELCLDRSSQWLRRF